MENQKNPYLGPNNSKWSRWILLLGISFSIIFIAHIFLTANFYQKRDLDMGVAIILSLTSAGGLTLLSEMMRKNPHWYTNFTPQKSIIRWSFLWALLTPFYYLGAFPLPSLFAMIWSIKTGEPVTFVLSLLTAGLFVWIYVISTKLSYMTFSSPQNRVIAQISMWIGIVSVIILLGNFNLPDITS
jgi:hypothetical protein